MIAGADREYIGAVQYLGTSQMTYVSGVWLGYGQYPSTSWCAAAPLVMGLMASAVA
jgi:hypothetical protein